MAERRTEPGVSAGRESEAARGHEPAIFEILEARHLDAVPGVAGEHEDAVALVCKSHRLRKSVGTRQFEFEDPPAVHSQRRTAVEQQRGGDVAAARQQITKYARFDR